MPESLRITLLVDNIAGRPPLLAEHGLAVLVEAGTRSLLFDTGQSQLVFLNAKSLAREWRTLEAVVLSHGHYDHTGGLLRLMDEAPEVRLFLHPQALVPRFHVYPDQSARSIGMMPLAVRRIREAARQDKVTWTEKPTEIFAGLYATGPIPRMTGWEDVGGAFYLDAEGRQPDTLPDDQSLYFESVEGTVVILGCAHAGVINTLHYIAGLTGQRHIHVVMGGMHLGNASPQRIEKTIAALRTFDVEHIALAHCTGSMAAARLIEALPNRVSVCQTGWQRHFTLTR